MSKKKTNTTNTTNPYTKTRSYLQIVYEDSMPADLFQRLQAAIDSGKLRYVICSPWHERDEIKKLNEQEFDEYLMSIGVGTQQMTREEFAAYREQRAQFFMSQNTALTYEAARKMVDDQLYAESQALRESLKKAFYKKKHMHLIIEFTNTIQLRYAEKYLKGLTNGSFVKPRENLRGAVRYLAHLDEDQTVKALYDPDQIQVYGDIKIGRFLESEDKSMTSLVAWETLQDLIDENNIRSMRDFEKMMRKQDIDLKGQVQKNVNLRSRAKDYILSCRTEERDELQIYKAVAAERTRERKPVEQALRGGATLAYAEAMVKQIESA